MQKNKQDDRRILNETSQKTLNTFRKFSFIHA